jgi:hypothetical protein
MRLSRRSRRVTLRITGGEPDAGLRFDAVLVLGRGRMRARALTGERTPFELQLPDEDCTAVVRARDPGPAFTVEYTVERAGERRLYGRSRRPLAILERRGAGIFVGGLPDPDAPDNGGPAVAAPAI